MWPGSGLVTAERDGYGAFARQRGRTLVKSKLTQENNRYKPARNTRAFHDYVYGYQINGIVKCPNAMG